MAATQVGSTVVISDEGDPNSGARPAGTADGHMIVAIGWNDTGDPAGAAQLAPVDTGWTPIGNLEVPGKGNGYAWYRRTAGPANYEFGCNAFSSWAVHVTAWSGVPAGAVPVALFAQSTTDNANVDAASIASGSYTGTDPLVLTGHYILSEGTNRAWTTSTPTNSGITTRGPEAQITGNWISTWFSAGTLSGKVATSQRRATITAGTEPWMAVAVAIPTAGVPSAISGAATAPLGGMSVQASGTPTVRAVAAAPLGGLAAAAAGTRKVSAAATAVLGGMSAAASATTRRTATAAAPLGALVATAAASVEVPAAAAAPLGGLAAGATAAVSVPAAAAAPLGGLTTSATAAAAHPGSAAAPLGPVSMSAAGTVTPPTPVDPIAAYSFDEAGTTALDATGNGHDFALGANLARTEDGHTAGGLTTIAQGVITQIAIPAFGQTPDRTVMMWAKGSGAVWYIRWQVASLDSGAWGILRLGGDIGVQLRDTSGFQRFVTTAPTDGEWHHYAATYNETTGAAAFYLDGVVAASGTFAGPIRADADTLDLAEFGSDTTIDDLRIYDAALTAEQVATAAATPVDTPVAVAATAPLGGLTTAASGTVTVPAAAAAALGGLTATATGSVAVPAAAQADLGSLATAAAGAVQVPAAAAANLGPLSVAAAGITVVPAVAEANLGGVVVAAASTPTGAASTPLGGLAAAADATTGVPAAAQADLGALECTAAAAVHVPAAAAASLGGLALEAAGYVAVAAAATAALGALVATAEGETTGAGAGSATAALGPLVATASAGRGTTGSAAAALGPLVAAASAQSRTEGVAAAPLGPVALTAAALRRLVGSAAVDLGALQAAAEGEAVSIITAAAPLGRLDVTAVGALDRIGSAAADLGPLLAAAAGARHLGAAAVADLGALAVIGTARIPILLGAMQPLDVDGPVAEPVAVPPGPRMTPTAAGSAAAAMTGG